MQGRKPATPGHNKAKKYIQQQYTQAGLQPFEANYSQRFSARGKNAYNLIATIEGQVPDAIVFTAHYDHLGKKSGHIYNGADDNASGVAAMLEIARQLKQSPLRHSAIFVATDAEETGLHGAKYFLSHPPIKHQYIRFNVNLDMIAHGGRTKRLYIAGGRKFPELKGVISKSIKQANVCLLAGHDGFGYNYNRQYRINWQRSSDHYVFLKQNIPYLFFSGADHKYYHTAKDTVDRIDPVFYTAVVESILNSVRLLDKAVL